MRKFALACGVWLLCVLAAVAVQARGDHAERASLYGRFGDRADSGSRLVAGYVDDVFATERRLAPQVTVGDSSAATLESTTALLGFPAALLLDREGRAVAVAPGSHCGSARDRGGASSSAGEAR